jgi:hypothetical protein
MRGLNVSQSTHLKVHVSPSWYMYGSQDYAEVAFRTSTDLPIVSNLFSIGVNFLLIERCTNIPVNASDLPASADPNICRTQASPKCNLGLDRALTELNGGLSTVVHAVKVSAGRICSRTYKTDIAATPC